MKRFILALLVGLGLGTVAHGVVVYNPLAPGMSVSVKTDSDGNLLVMPGGVTLPEGPLTSLGTIRLRTTTDGYLAVALASGGTLTPDAIRVSDGTAAAPSMAFGSQTNTGFYWVGTNNIGVAANGTFKYDFDTVSLSLASDMAFSWGNSANSPSATKDLFLYRDAANTLAQRNGTNAQIFRVYGNVISVKYTSVSHDGTNGSIGANSGNTVFTAGGNITLSPGNTLVFVNGALLAQTATGGVGYGTGAGGAVTQGTSRTTGVTLNTVTGDITLFSAAGSATPATFTVTNSAVAVTDNIVISQKSGTDLYELFITNVAAGSFKVTFFTTGGTTVEQPVFHFSVIKGVSS